MKLRLLEYRLLLGGGVQRLSERFPEVSWEVRPLGTRWLVRCDGAVRDVRTIAGLARTTASSADGSIGRASYLYEPSAVEREVLEELGRWGATVLPPMTWSAGTANLQLATSRAAPPRGWIRAHPEARLVRKRSVRPDEIMDALDRSPDGSGSLSPRQSEVLLEAVRLGYYEVPRRAAVVDIAREVGLARSTTEEHLRAAESTMIRSVAPLVAARHRLRQAAETSSFEPPLEHYARYSAELQLYLQMAIGEERIYRMSLHRRRPAGVPVDHHPYLTRVAKHLATGADALVDLPVELGVGSFARRVLEEVRRIPPGTTLTYSQLARRLGHPRSARAVGNALAANPALVVVPCHRVVPAAGGVGRYSGEGGSATKRRLLELEGATLIDPVDTRGKRSSPSPGSARTPRPRS